MNYTHTSTHSSYFLSLSFCKASASALIMGNETDCNPEADSHKQQGRVYSRISSSVFALVI